jgi:hypothetical protein
MLVGGIKVVGVYVWVNDNAFKNSTIMLCQVYICYPISVTSVYMLCYVLAMKHWYRHEYCVECRIQPWHWHIDTDSNSIM